MSTESKRVTEQISHLKALIPEIVFLLNPEQLKILATNMDFMLQINRGPAVSELSVKDTLLMLKTGQLINKENLVKIIIQINLPKVRSMQNDMIDKYGYYVQGVGVGGPNEPNFAYTVGLSKTTGFELIAMTGGLENLNMLVNEYSQVAMRKEDITQENTSVFQVLIKGKQVPLRTKAVKVDTFEACKEHIRFRISDDPFDVYQIYIADHNNILPDEPGYDVEFIQPLFTKV